MESTTLTPSDNMAELMQKYGANENIADLLTLMNGALSDPRTSVSAIYVTADGIMRDPSLARKKSREDSRLMLRDPRIKHSINKRKMACMQLPFEVVPEDEKNEDQVAAADELKFLFERFDYLELFENLLDATFYGVGPSELCLSYDDRDRVYYVSKTYPIHPDSIVYRLDGEPALRVGMGYTGENRIMAMESPARKLDDAEKQLLIIHNFNYQAADYWEPEEVANIYHGSGLREDLWYFWFMSHKVHKDWLRWIETYAAGIPLIKHVNNDSGRSAAIQMMKDFKQGGFMMLPISGDPIEAKSVEIELLTPSPESGNIYHQYIVEFCTKFIKLIIEGQDLTSDTASTGLGSGVADQHRTTFEEIRNYDARKLQDTITKQLISRLQRWNNIMPDEKFFFRFVIEDQSPAEALDAAERATRMGVRIKEDEVRAKTGYTRPEETDDVIGGPNLYGPGGTGEESGPDLGLRLRQIE